MSDPTDNGQRKPLSSISSHSSGTSAPSISIQQNSELGASEAPQDETGGSTSQDAGSAQQAREDFPAADIDQNSATAEPEAEEYLTQAHEPVAGSGTDDALPAAEPQFEQTAPAENEGGYTAPAVEWYSEPVVESHDTQPASEHHFQPTPDPATVDEPAYTSNAVGDLAALSAPDGGVTPPPNGLYPKATEELRAAVLETIAENEARQATTLALFDQVSRRFTAVLEEAGVDAAQVTLKVMEFAQASLKNNLELAQSYAAARTVPDIFGLHAAYMTRQFQLLNAQAEELRELTSKIALRNAAGRKPQADDSTAKGLRDR